MNANTFAQPTDLIGKYAAQTGAGFEASRASVVKMLHEGLGADVSEAFSQAHVGVSRLVEQLSTEISGPEQVDRIRTAHTLIMLISAFMIQQENIHGHHEQLSKLLSGAPQSIIMKGVLLAATPDIKRSTHDLAALIDHMSRLFVGNVVSAVLEQG